VPTVWLTDGTKRLMLPLHDLRQHERMLMRRGPGFKVALSVQIAATGAHKNNNPRVLNPMGRGSGGL
jgi:hypothetical protein